MYHQNASQELEDEIHACETLQAIEISNRLPRKVAMKLDKIISSLPPPDMEDKPEPETDIKKKITLPTPTLPDIINVKSDETLQHPPVKRELHSKDSGTFSFTETKKKHVCAICSAEYTDKHSFTDQNHTSKTPIHKCSPRNFVCFSSRSVIVTSV